MKSISQGGEHAQPWHLACTALISLFGIVGNIVVLMVYFKSKRISRASAFNIYITALACVDMLVSALIVPYYVLRLDIYTMPGGAIGMFICKFLIGGAPFWLLDVSAYLLVAIALERRRAILRPFSMLEERQIWKTVLVILLLFVLAGVDQTPTWIGEYYTANNSTFGSFCSYRRNQRQLSLALHLISFVLDYLIPLIIILFCYIQLKKRLSQMAEGGISGGGVDDEGREVGIVNEEVVFKHTKIAKNTISTMTWVVVAFFVCITPDEIAYLTFQFIPVFRMNHILYQVTGLIRFSNSFVNPILYSYQSVHFRRNFVDVFDNTFLMKLWRSAGSALLKKRACSSGQSSSDPLLTRLLDESQEQSVNHLI